MTFVEVSHLSEYYLSKSLEVSDIYCTWVEEVNFLILSVHLSTCSKLVVWTLEPTVTITSAPGKKLFGKTFYCVCYYECFTISLEPQRTELNKFWVNTWTQWLLLLQGRKQLKALFLNTTLAHVWMPKILQSEVFVCFWVSAVTDEGLGRYQNLNDCVSLSLHTHVVPEALIKRHSGVCVRSPVRHKDKVGSELESQRARPLIVSVEW